MRTRRNGSMGGEHGREDGGFRESDAFELSVVIPTRNEAGNIERVFQRLQAALEGHRFEVIFVDDSDDDTPAVIRALRAREADPSQIRLIHRDGARRNGGLGGAVVAGLKAAHGTYVCVMDADLQHPPEVVPQLLERAHQPDAPNLVVASRYASGGTSGLRGARAAISKTSTALAKAAFPRALADISDPMSGFFLFRRADVDARSLKPNGFKILMEVAVRTSRVRAAEVGFAFSDREWGDSKASLIEGTRFAKHVVRLRRSTRRGVDPTHRYNIHGIVTVESDGRLPELEAFRVGHLDAAPTIRVHIGLVPRSPHTLTAHDSVRRYFHYTETPGSTGFAAEIEIGDHITVVASPFLRYSPHVLYTNLVEPLLRWTFVERGYALVHAAAVVDGDQAYLITARTDTGKTTTMLKLLDEKPYRFIADDFCIVSPDGTVRSYPKPLTISQHTLHAVKRPRLDWHKRATLPLQSRLHSREGRLFAFILAKTGLPVASINAYTQTIVPPPKYSVTRLVPGVQIATRARFAGMFVIQRGERSVTKLDPEDALEILLANCEDAYGFPPYHKIEDFLLASASEDLPELERSIIESAVKHQGAVALSSPNLDWATTIQTLIEEFGDTGPALNLVVEEQAEAEARRRENADARFSGGD